MKRLFATVAMVSWGLAIFLIYVDVQKRVAM